ncbi:putative sensor domain DACNV-containing protein [Sorangium sp. So ce861]|uniref:putative sensor domain DACNV-containing protein n=1 Tax=Sorangium sp. So ce861 TaxID=3133323 RepID=UPI003F6247CB
MSLIYPREMLNQLIEQHELHLACGNRKTAIALADTVFFASLMLEEGESIQVAIVYDEGGSSTLVDITDSEAAQWGEEGPPSAWRITEIERRPFDSRTLAKLSRGLRYGTHLVVVGGRAPELWIDGIARRDPHTDGGAVIRIAAPRPGVLVFEKQDRELLRYDAGVRVSPAIDVLTRDCVVGAAINAIIGRFGAAMNYSPSEWITMQILRQMRTTRAGAILALLPQAPTDEMLAEVRYRRTDAHTLANRMQLDWQKRMAWISALVSTSNKSLDANKVDELSIKRTERDVAREELDAAIEDIAQLSAIDGAILAGPRLAIYGAGYIIPGIGEVKPFKALDAHAINAEAMPSHYGARHKAAFSFAHAHRGGVAFVVSEDGPVSCALRVNDRVIVWPVRISET